MRHTITNTSQFQDALDKTYEDFELTKDKIPKLSIVSLDNKLRTPKKN